MVSGDVRVVNECINAAKQRVEARVPEGFSKTAEEWGAYLADKHGPPAYCEDCTKANEGIMRIVLNEQKREIDRLQKMLDAIA